MAVLSHILSNSAGAASQKLFSDQVRHGATRGAGQVLGRGEGSAREMLKQSKDDLAAATKAMSPEQRKAVRNGGPEMAEVAALRGAERARADEIVGGMKDIGTAAKDWALARDVSGSRAMTLARRYGTLAAGSVAVGAGARFMTGGSMTHDRDGNRDIAGIPFI